MKILLLLLGCGLFFLSCQKQLPSTVTSTETEKANTNLTVMCIPYGVVKAGSTVLPHPRPYGQSAWGGNRIAFLARDQVMDGFYGADVLNVSTGTWSLEPYSTPADFRFAAGCNSKLAIAGGAIGGLNAISDVHILDLTSNQWSTASLSIPRSAGSAVGYGNKLFFAGGVNQSAGNVTYSRVDIYDASTNGWSTAELSHAGIYDGVAAANNIVAFTGAEQLVGANNLTKTVDLYDIATNQWSKSALSTARAETAGVGAANLIFFAGGYDANGESNVCDIYNTSTKTWTVKHLAHNKGKMLVCELGSKVIFRGDPHTTPECYDVCSKSWGTVTLNNNDPGAMMGSSGSIMLIGDNSMAEFKPGLFIIN